MMPILLPLGGRRVPFTRSILRATTLFLKDIPELEIYAFQPSNNINGNSQEIRLLDYRNMLKMRSTTDQEELLAILSNALETNTPATWLCHTGSFADIYQMGTFFYALSNLLAQGLDRIIPGKVVPNTLGHQIIVDQFPLPATTSKEEPLYKFSPGFINNMGICVGAQVNVFMNHLHRHADPVGAPDDPLPPYPFYAIF